MKPKIVLVMDFPKNIEHADLSRKDLEGYNCLASRLTRETFEEFATVKLYTNLEKFAKRILLHKNSIVFPMRWGTTSRTSKGLIPSLCETHGIRYVGADSYTQILCNDKYLSKMYARDFGLQVPRGLLIRKEQTASEIQTAIKYLTYPVVIKPNFGGGSSGISSDSIADSADAALELIYKLFEYHFSPVLAEEYVEGYEVSLLLVGNKSGVQYCDEMQLSIGEESFFKHNLWGFETKKVDLFAAHYVPSSLISASDREKAEQLFLSFEKADYLRIDGRVNENGFFVIELSPDCYIGPESDFSVAFEQRGNSLSEFYQILVSLVQS